MGQNVHLYESYDGNDLLIAEGGARLVWRRMQQQQQGEGAAAAAAPSSSSAPGGSSSSSGRGLSYVDLLPDMWSRRLGVHLAGWMAFGTEAVKATEVTKLESELRRIHPAAMREPTEEPDREKRQRHKQQMLAYVNHCKQKGVGPAPKVDNYVPMFYSLLPPATMLPCGPVELPWQLERHSTGDTLPLKLYKLDLLGYSDEVEAGRWKMRAPKNAKHFITASVEVDEEGHITCSAVVKKSKDDVGTPVEVNTDHDRLAAERRDRQKRVMELTEAARSFLSQPVEASNAGSGDETAAAGGGGGRPAVSASGAAVARSGARAAAFGADLTAYDATAAAAKKGGGKAAGDGSGARAEPAPAAAVAAVPMAPAGAAVAVEGHSGGHVVPVFPGLPAIGPAAQMAWGRNQPPSQCQLAGGLRSGLTRLPSMQSRGAAAAAVAAAVKGPGSGAPLPTGSHRKHPRKSRHVRHVKMQDSGSESEELENEEHGVNVAAASPAAAAAAAAAAAVGAAAGAAAGGGGGPRRDGGAMTRSRSMTPEPKRKRV